MCTIYWQKVVLPITVAQSQLPPKPTPVHHLLPPLVARLTSTPRAPGVEASAPMAPAEARGHGGIPREVGWKSREIWRESVDDPKKMREKHVKGLTIIKLT